MKSSELAMVGLVVSLAGYGGFVLGVSGKAPAPAPVSFTVNLPPGLVELNAPLVQLDCDRDPEVTISGANIEMNSGDSPAINIGASKGGLDGE